MAIVAGFFIFKDNLAFHMYKAIEVPNKMYNMGQTIPKTNGGGTYEGFSKVSYHFLPFSDEARIPTNDPRVMGKRANKMVISLFLVNIIAKKTDFY